VILKAILTKLREVLKVVVFASLICDRLRLFLSIINCVKALTINVFFLVGSTIHVVDRLKFHLGILSVFVAGFGATLTFMITSIH
jgi:hypothetical protein